MEHSPLDSRWNAFFNRKTLSALFVFMLALALVKQIFVMNLPIQAYCEQVYDDAWNVTLAQSLLRGEWLGEYDKNTLVKCIFSPLYLAACNKLGVSFLDMTAALYSIACMVFVYGVRDLFQRVYSPMILYVILLFNPVSFAEWTFQRVYRCGLTMIQALLIIGCFCALYLKRKQSTKSLIGWAVGAGLGLSTLWHTREDGIWILPFVVVVTVILVALCFVRKPDKVRLFGKLQIRPVHFKKTNGKRLVLVLLPVLMLVAASNIVSAINFQYYGIYSYNDMTDSNFSNMVKTFYSVKTDEPYFPRVDISLDKIAIICEVSPTLKSIENEIDEWFRIWGALPPERPSVENGMFIWPMRDALEAAGYYRNAAETDEFCGRVIDEVNQAFADGRLQKQATMPSNMMPPWHSGYWTALPKTTLKFMWFVGTFDTVGVSSAPSRIHGPGEHEIRNWEGITNNLAVDTTFGEDPAAPYLQKYVDRANRLTGVYQKAFPVVAIAAVPCFLFLFVRFFQKIRKRGENPYLPSALVLAGIFLTFLTLVAGVAYNHIASVFSQYYMYLSGAYPLLIGLCVMSVLLAAEEIALSIRNSRPRRARGRHSAK